MELFERIKEQFHDLSKLYQSDLNRLRAIVRYLADGQTDTFKQNIFNRDIIFLRDSLNSRRQFLGNTLLNLKENPYFFPAFNIAQSLSLRFPIEERLINSFQADFDSGQYLTLRLSEDKYRNSAYYQALTLYEDSFNLSKNAQHYLDGIAYYKDLFDMNQFVMRSFKTAHMNMLEIYKKGAPIKGGVVIVPGITGTIESLRLLGMRLASKNYLVVLSDLPGHGVPLGDLNIAVAVERIYDSVNYLKRCGANKVAVLGHSLGGIGAMFACAGYNYELEKTIFELLRRVVASGEVAEKNPTRMVDYLREFDSNYNKIKGAIENSIQRNPMGAPNSGRIVRIDAIVAMGAPENMQRMISPILLMGKFGYKASKAIIDGLINKPVKMGRSALPLPFLLSGRTEKPIPFEPYSDEASMRGVDYMKIQNLRVEASHFKDFIEYMKNFQNPADYMALLLFFSQKSDVTGELRSTLIRDFVEDYVKKIPKLFVYGSEDTFLKPQKKDNRKRIETVYRLMGNATVRSFGRLQHQLIQGVPDVKVGRMQAVTAPPVVEEIIRFLDQRLG